MTISPLSNADRGTTVRARHFPQIFEAPDQDRAKEIILTTEGPGWDSATRWAVETPYVLEQITKAVKPQPDMLVLDYGVGIGRLAKAMIEATGCRVVGVDPSPSMRQLAGDYVGSDRFIALSPGQFDALVAAGLRVRAAIAVWVLQHCERPDEDIARIRRSLCPEAGLWVLNMKERAVPVVLDQAESSSNFCWVSDDIDIAALLRRAFAVVAEGAPDTARVPNLPAGAFWMNLRRRGG